MSWKDVTKRESAQRGVYFSVHSVSGGVFFSVLGEDQGKVALLNDQKPSTDGLCEYVTSLGVCVCVCGHLITLKYLITLKKHE